MQPQYPQAPAPKPLPQYTDHQSGKFQYLHGATLRVFAAIILVFGFICLCTSIGGTIIAHKGWNTTTSSSSSALPSSSVSIANVFSTLQTALTTNPNISSTIVAKLSSLKMLTGYPPAAFWEGKNCWQGLFYMVSGSLGIFAGKGEVWAVAAFTALSIISGFAIAPYSLIQIAPFLDAEFGWYQLFTDSGLSEYIPGAYTGAIAVTFVAVVSHGIVFICGSIASFIACMRYNDFRVGAPPPQQQGAQGAPPGGYFGTATYPQF